jgi:hypothetical protein
MQADAYDPTVLKYERRRHRPTIARSAFFIALAALLNFATPFSGMIALPLLPVVPAIVQLVPQLREIGDSTPGDSIRFLFVVLSLRRVALLPIGFWFERSA